MQLLILGHSCGYLDPLLVVCDVAVSELTSDNQILGEALVRNLNISCDMSV
jgi:hypothetical protein